MKKYYFLVFIILLASCNKMTRVRDVDVSKLRGYDYRLFKNTPAWELAKAVWDEEENEIDRILTADSTLINYREPKYGQTLLFLTIWHNQEETLEYLLKKGADPNLYDFYDGTSPIIHACQNSSNIELVKLLIRFGANPNDVEFGKRRKGNSTRFTPLMAACQNGNLDLVRLLLKAGVDINYRDEYEISALSRATIQNKYDIIQLLLKSGADYSIPVYHMVDGRPVMIQEALRKLLPALGSRDHKVKMEIVSYLKGKGIDYAKTPIPEYILKIIKKKYKENWPEYIKRY